jgi:hypothetical protein
MKKLGTPNGAGPGNANEYVGFAGVGTPPEARRPAPRLVGDPADGVDAAERRVAGFDGFAGGAPRWRTVGFEWLFTDRLWSFVAAEGIGAGCGVGLDGVVGVVVVDVCPHDSDRPTTGSLIALILRSPRNASAGDQPSLMTRLASDAVGMLTAPASASAHHHA